MAFLDPSGRGPKTGTLAIRGLCYLTAVALVITLLVLQSRGAFRDDLRATAVVSDVGDGLPPGSDVKVRGVLVGTVGTVESTPGGARHVVQLNLKPEHAQGIPASVKARILPTNIFGAPFVDLVPEAGDDTVLAAGATVPGDDSVEALQLQTAMTEVRDLLAAVEPAKLNAALTGVADALDGRGAQLGSMIDRLNSYLSALNPHAGTFGHDLSTLAAALEGLQANAPALLDTVDSALVTSRTVVEKQQQLANTLTGGAATVDTVHGLLQDNGDRLIRMANQSAPVLREVAKDAKEIPLSFEALSKGVASFAGAFPPPHHWLTLDLIFTVTPFTPYTARNCPAYGALEGPNCDDPLPPQPDPLPVPPPQPPAPPAQPLPQTAAPAPAPSAPFGGMVGPVGSGEEQDMIGSMVGDAANALGSLGSLLLGPFFRGTTVVPGGK
ncbi:MCE family protein [Amycolatopsis nigrescens]|uniref:MCE family protein n=1 Tax=Amycolatopsis nigrescens TaxID=381445 RepID=UPI00036A4DF4|nr:MCE family protein [Amycolatopsis nigrescens]